MKIKHFTNSQLDRKQLEKSVFEDRSLQTKSKVQWPEHCLRSIQRVYPDLSSLNVPWIEAVLFSVLNGKSSTGEKRAHKFLDWVYEGFIYL